MTTFPQHDRYKDSGAEWLGQIPAHWDADRLFSVFNQRVETGHGHLPILSITIGEGVQVEQFTGDRKKRLIEDRDAYKRAAEGDIAYNTMRMWQGAVGIVPTDGLVSPAYVVARPIKLINSRYYSYLMRTEPFQVETNRHSYGIVSDRNRLYWQGFKGIQVPIPPKAEQDRIVGFLDEKAAEIDALIAKKQRQIQLLDEQHSSLINRAVTRGLNLNEPLRNSGIVWLPKIPRTWQAMKLRHLAAMIQTGPFGSQLHSEEYVEGGTPVINPSHMKGGAIVPDRRCTVGERKVASLARHKLRPGDIVFARRGELGRCALVTEAEAGWLCGTGSLLLRPKSGIFEPRYLVQVLSDSRLAALLTLQSVGSTMDNLNTAMIASLNVPLPPMHEQVMIMENVRGLKCWFDQLRQSIESQVQSLETLRRTLIAHAVTGKIRV